MAAAVVLGRSYRRLKIPLALFVLLVGYSRVYLGVHYPTDCVAGFAWGALCGLAVVKFGEGGLRGSPSR